MMKRALALAAFALTLSTAPVLAETTAKPLPTIAWSFDGPFGKFDRASMQRGFQVYREVCAACHSLKELSYRNLGEPGGPFEAHRRHNVKTGAEDIVLGPPAEPGERVDPNDNPFVKAIAADADVTDQDPQTGDDVKRKGRPADRFHAPFPSDGAARAANGGAVPPDFSVIARARDGGADYIRAFVTGFVDTPPAGLQVPVGKHYNPYFHGDLSSFWTGDPRAVPVGGYVSMPPQLTPDRVTYSDGTKATPDQMARDVATFLTWASDTHMEERKQLGLEVMVYLLILAGLVYLAYRNVWKDVKH